MPEARPVVEIVSPDGTALAAGALSDWDVAVEVERAGAGRLEELLVTVAYLGDRPIERGVRIGLELPPADAPPSWLVPGLFYGENRPVACRRRFPRYERGVEDPAGMVAERWSFRVDRAATGVVIGRSGGRMAALAVDETSAIGPAGLGLEGSGRRTRIWVDLPFREEPVAYRGHEVAEPPDVRTHAWQPGQRATLRVSCWSGADEDHGEAALLRQLHARADHAREPAAWVSVEEAAALVADGLLRWHYHPEHRALYETATFDRDAADGPHGDRPHMHVGWVSGAPWAAQLLAWGRRSGSDAHVRAGLDVLDHIAENRCPSGTFWAEWTLERGWGSGWSPGRTIHANTIGQATLFFLRALRAEDRQALSHPAWEDAVRANLAAVAGRQRADGNLGAAHDPVTGAVARWDGAAGLVWIAALLDGAERYGEAAYREAALRAGSWYRRFVDERFIHGAPEDVDLAPTSEDGYNAVIAFAALHRATGEAAWLDVARRAADWALTFRYTYDVAFDAATVLGSHRFRTRGTDQASPANQHLHHFGLLMQPELVELSRLTGDDYYRRRAAEALDAWRQMIVRHDGELGGRRGMVAERYHQTDCHAPKGSIGPFSHAWSAGVLLLACLHALEDPDALPS